MHTRSALAEARSGLLRALPTALGCMPLAFILGVQASQQGMSAATTWLMSAFNFAGGSEFAAVALWSAAPPVLVIAVTTWLINSRHIVMGAAMSLYTKHLSTPKSLAAYFLMCDEVWAIAMAETAARKRDDPAAPAEVLFSFPWYLGVGLAFWTLWAAGAGAGAAFAGALGDMSAWGFQMAFPATFISLLVMMWPGAKHALPLVLSAIVAGAASLILPTHWTVLLGTLAGLAATALGADRLFDDDKEAA